MLKRLHNTIRTTPTILIGALLLCVLAFYLFFPDVVFGQQETDRSEWQWMRELVAMMLTTVFGWMTALLYLAGIFLNYAVSFTVLQMGQHVADNPGINVAWSLLRDLANIIFIFALVFIGINTIVGNTTYGYKQFLAKLIIAALLVNFSMFFTKVVVDVSNRFATEIYELIFPGGATVCADAEFFRTDPAVANTCLGTGMTGTTMNQFGLVTLINDPSYLSGVLTTDPNMNVETADRIALISFFGSIFVLITGFIFLAGAVMLLVRFAILILLMIVSPLALALWAVPKGSGYFYTWLRMLLNQSFFAPLFFLFIWISLLLMQGFSEAFGSGSGSFAAALVAGEDLSPTVIFIQFGLMSIFMITSLVASRELGAWGAAGAINMGNRWSKNAYDRTRSFAWRHKGKIAAGAAGAAVVPGIGVLPIVGGIAGVGGWSVGKRAARTVVGGGAKAADDAIAKVAPGAVGQTIRSVTTKPLAEKATFATGASYTQSQKQSDESISETIAKFAQKNDSVGLAEFISSLSDWYRPGVNLSKQRIFENLSEDIKADVYKYAQKRNTGVPSDDADYKGLIDSLVLGQRADKREKFVAQYIKQNQNDMPGVDTLLQKLTPDERNVAYRDHMSDSLRASYEGHLQNKERYQKTRALLTEKKDTKLLAEVDEAWAKNKDIHQVLDLLEDDQRVEIESHVSQWTEEKDESIQKLRTLLSEEAKGKTDEASTKTRNSFTRKRRRNSLALEISDPTKRNNQKIEELVTEMSPAEIIPFYRQKAKSFDEASQKKFAEHMQSRLLRKLIQDENVENSAVEELTIKAIEAGNQDVLSMLDNRNNQDARSLAARIEKRGIAIPKPVAPKAKSQSTQPTKTNPINSGDGRDY